MLNGLAGCARERANYFLEQLCLNMKVHAPQFSGVECHWYIMWLNNLLKKYNVCVRRFFLIFIYSHKKLFREKLLWKEHLYCILKTVKVLKTSIIQLNICLNSKHLKKSYCSQVSSQENRVHWWSDLVNSKF